jgi:hypothetical protein
MTSEEGLEKARIIKEGRAAERKINGARLAAQKAWNEWRAYGTYKTPEGHVNSTVSAPVVSMIKPGTDKNGQTGIIIQVQTDAEHPEHARLREIAEAADIVVLDLEDTLAMYAAVAPTVRKDR